MHILAFAIDNKPTTIFRVVIQLDSAECRLQSLTRIRWGVGCAVEHKMAHDNVKSEEPRLLVLLLQLA